MISRTLGTRVKFVGPMFRGATGTVVSPLPVSKVVGTTVSVSGWLERHYLCDDSYRFISLDGGLILRIPFRSKMLRELSPLEALADV